MERTKKATSKAGRAELTAAEAAFAGERRVARLATSDGAGHPTAVPVCYAYDGARFYTPLDEKPKRVAATTLRRVRNILATGEAALLIDQYADDWSQLGYLLIHANAALLPPASEGHADAVALLRERYPQYRAMAIEDQPVIALTPYDVTSWGPALAAAGEDARSTASKSEWLRPGRGADVLALARGRRSVRAFQERPVPRPALEAMLEAARWAPSPHGRQPWRFVVLTRPAAKAKLAAAMGEEWRRTLAMDGQDAATIALRLEKSRERIRTAPALILACLYLNDLDRYPDAERARDEEVMAIQSLGAAIQNMLLAAYAEGLDTGWMCAPLFAPDAVRAALDLDASLLPHALIPVGYLAAEPKRRPHRPWQELVVRFE